MKKNLNPDVAERDDVITPFQDFWRKFKKQKTAVAAAIFFLLLVFIAIFCYKIAPYGINECDYASPVQGPTAQHWLGTDEFGRDLFSRILCGTRISLAVAFSAVTIAAILGSMIGLIAGYIGGTFDTVVMSICDVLYAFPGMILAIAIVAILGPGLTNVVIAVVVFRIPIFARIVRGNTLQLKNSVYVRAAVSLGASHSLEAHLPGMPAERDRAVFAFDQRVHHDLCFFKLPGHGRNCADSGMGPDLKRFTHLHFQQPALCSVPGYCDSPDSPVL